MDTFSLRQSTLEDLELAEVFTFPEHPNQYTLLRNENPVALFRLSFAHGIIKSAEMEVIEVLDEGCGYGSEAINQIFKEFNLEEITGVSIIAATRFWAALGAKRLDGKSILYKDGHIRQEYFTLSKSDFEKYKTRERHYYKQDDRRGDLSEIAESVRCFNI